MTLKKYFAHVSAVLMYCLALLISAGGFVDSLHAEDADEAHVADLDAPGQSAGEETDMGKVLLEIVKDAEDTDSIRLASLEILNQADAAGKDMAPALLNVLENPETSYSIRTNTEKLIANIGQTITPDLLEILADEDAKTRFRASAAFILKEIAQEEEEVKNSLSANNDIIKKEAARRKRIDAVIEFADNVLEHGRDQWGDYRSPLFADGLNVNTLDPVVWRYRGNEWIISNFASQQNLLRTLVGLSNISADPQYRKTAEEVTEYMFDNHRASCGLLYWGGHQFVDLSTGRNVGEFDADCHEFKNNFPFYEFLWEVDPEATEKFLEAFWNVHIMDWERLDMNRHGSYGSSMGDLWDNEFGDPEPFFIGRGLTFINAGTDLIYAGAMFYQLGGKEGALEWAKRLAEQYVNARHPETGLGVYQYSKPRRRSTPPDEGPLPTGARFGDRAENQFKEVYGDVAKEGWAIFAGRPRAIYAVNGFIQLGLAEKLGERGSDLLEWTIDGLKAYADYGYCPDENHFRPMWADGADLSGDTFPRSGYYGARGTEFSPLEACEQFLMTYARAYRLTGDSGLWDTVRMIAKGNDLGDIGPRPGQDMNLNVDTDNSDPEGLFSLLEIYRIEENPRYLELAEVIADNIIENRFHNGFFLESENHINANFNAIEPLALLSLEAVMQGEPEKAPDYNLSRGFIHGRFDGHGRTYDSRAIWAQTESVTLYFDQEQITPTGTLVPKEGGVIFDGTEDYVVFPDVNSAFEDEDSFTIALRARILDDNRFLCAYRYHLSGDAFTTRGDNQLEVKTGIEGADWHFIAITYEGAASDQEKKLSIYVDGLLADTDTTTGSPLSTYEARPLSLGRTQHSGGIYSSVEVENEIYIYSKALDVDELQKLKEHY